MTATSEAVEEYMVNAISVGIKPIGMKLGEDVDLKASYKIKANTSWPGGKMSQEAQKNTRIKFQKFI